MEKVKFLLFSILISISLVFSSCEECKDTEILCDLASAFIAPVRPELAVFADFLLKGIVENQRETGKCFDNSSDDDAKRSNTGYKVQYKSSNKSTNDEWTDLDIGTNTGDQKRIDLQTPEIEAGDDVELQPKFQFESQGQYRFIQLANSLEEFQERDMSNNGKTSTENEMNKSKTIVEPGTKTYEPIVITVIDPDNKGRKLKKGELPKVYFKGYEIIE